MLVTQHVYMDTQATQILENNTLKKLGKARVDEITLIEHRRAHNISIELSGIKLSFEEIKVCHVIDRQQYR